MIDCHRLTEVSVSRIRRPVKTRRAANVRARSDSLVRVTGTLIDRLAQSKRVRQSIIRYAFRYFLGRNERLSDSQTLIDADQAYLKSGGSFDAVILSLLTSDSFIYRKPIEN